MASSETLFVGLPFGNEYTGSNYASLGARNGHPTLDFDDTTDETAIWTGVLPTKYSGNGITILIRANAASATSGNYIMTAAIERIDTGTLDIDADSFASSGSATVACSGTSGINTETSISFASGAAMDSLAAGETFRLKITRNSSSGSDTVVGDMRVMSVEIRET